MLQRIRTPSATCARGVFGFRAVTNIEGRIGPSEGQGRPLCNHLHPMWTPCNRRRANSALLLTRASSSQAEGRGFETRLALQDFEALSGSCLGGAFFSGVVDANSDASFEKRVWAWPLKRDDGLVR